MSDAVQPPLFDTPDPPVRPRLVERPGKVRYAAVRPVRRTLCDDCCSEIHRLGQGVAPLPSPVRWRRTAPGEAPVNLCGPHRDARVAERR